MTEVYIKYNPYRLTTDIKINGNHLSNESVISQVVSNKRLQSWIGDLPEMLKNERGSREFKVTFHGNTLDYDDVKEAFSQANSKGIIGEFQTSFEEATSDNGVYERILQTYNDLMEDSEFTSSLSATDREGLENAIKRVENNVFPIHVIATMSSGKSTLINALLSRKMMPSQNEACTAIITEIMDNDKDIYSAIVYDRSDNRIKTIPQLTYEIMDELNGNDDISKVAIEGNIPFLTADDTVLKLVDTPGPNNARNSNHRETTYKNINSATENMILYVLNYTQLATNDDENLLRHVAEEIKKGGKETRDRFIFVLNKMDQVKSEDSVGHAIEVTKAYLAKHGIEDPQIFPCSAFAALGIRTLLQEIDPYDSDAIDDAVEATNNDDIADVANLVRKINRKEELHLEVYSTLTPSENEKLRVRLEKAVGDKNRKEEALIHSGICSIESAIKAYVKKYAKAKKIKDFAEPLEKQLHQVQQETKAKLAAVSGGEEADNIRKRSAAIKKMIEQGEEAKKFKEKIDAIDPMPQINAEAQILKDNAQKELVRRFRGIGNKIEGRSNALDFINAFSDDAAEALSNLSAQLEILVEKQITNVGEELVSQYQAKLEGFDDSIGTNLDFSTSDLVSGVLSRMKNSAVEYGSTGEKRSEQQKNLDDIHRDEVEEYTVDVIKMKEVKETIQDGVEKIQTGEERVVVGTHKEKVGEREVSRKGFFGKIIDLFKGKRKEDIYEEFEDVEYRPTYEYVPKLVEVIKQIPTVEQEVREKVHYVVDRAELQKQLVMPITIQMEDDIESLKSAAEEWIAQLKQQFISTFDEIDQTIVQKYSELEGYTQQQNALDERRNQLEELLQFIEGNINEINEILDV